MSKPFRWVLCSFALLISMSSSWSNSISALDLALQKNDYSKVLAITTSLIHDHPENPEWRLKQSVALMELGQIDAAEKQLNLLRHDYPNNPSPLLNLAAIKARQGKLIEARDLLEQCLSLNPDLISARASLSTIYLGLAWDSYQKQTTMQPNQSDHWKKQMQSIESLLSEHPAHEQSASAIPAQQAPVIPRPQPPALPVQAAIPLDTPIVLTPSKPRIIPAVVTPVTTPVTTPVIAPPELPLTPIRPVVPVIPVPEPKQEPLPAIHYTLVPMSEKSAQPTTVALAEQLPQPSVPATRRSVSESEIMATLEHWRTSWMNGDSKAYLNCYSEDFMPENRSRNSWIAMKKNLLKQKIQVDITVLSVTTGELTTIQFKQRYRANNHADDSIKEIQLIRIADDWKILSEKTLAQPTSPQ